MLCSKKSRLPWKRMVSLFKTLNDHPCWAFLENLYRSVSLFSLRICKDRATDTLGQLQICKDLYRCSKVFCTDFLWIFFRSFWEAVYLHFWASSTSIFADQGSVSGNSPSLEILEKESLPLSRKFWCLGNIRYWFCTVIIPFHLNFPEVVVQLWEARLPHWLWSGGCN